MVNLDLNVWLKAEDVEPEAELVFVNAGEKTEIPGIGEEEPKEAFEVTVQFKNGEERAWTMNKTSQRAVAAAYGANTDNWVGKKVIAFVTSQNVRGMMKKVIYARVPQ